jgi:hypothetical protein
MINLKENKMTIDWYRIAKMSEEQIKDELIALTSVYDPEDPFDKQYINALRRAFSYRIALNNSGK